MPEISRFYGIVVAMYYNDHAPPHFHARYGEREIRMNILNGDILSGSLPARAEKLVAVWRRQHRKKLLLNWSLAAARQPLRAIEALE